MFIHYKTSNCQTVGHNADDRAQKITQNIRQSLVNAHIFILTILFITISLTQSVSLTKSDYLYLSSFSVFTLFFLLGHTTK